MYLLISRWLTEVLLLNGFGKKQYKKIYEYGFECCLSIAMNVITVLFVGFLTNSSRELLAYMVFYTILRIYTGGAHCKNHMRCIVTYLCLGLISIKIFYQLGLLQYGNLIIMGLLFLSMLIVFLFAPVESPNKYIKAELKKTLRRKSLIAIAIQILIIRFAFIIFHTDAVITSAAAGIFTQSLLLIPLFNKKERDYDGFKSDN